MPNHQVYPAAGNKTLNREPNGHPALQKPKSPGGLPEVHRDNTLGFSAGSVKSRSNYDTHLEYPENSEG